MANMRISLPNIDAVATYSIRSTGGQWSVEEALNFGFAEPTRTFSSLECDEFRVTLNFSQSYDFVGLFLSTLNLKSGLSFTIDVDSVVHNFNQRSEQVMRERESQLFRFASTSGSTVVLTITGIGQRKLSFGQLAVFNESVSPSLNISEQSRLRRQKVYKEERTALGFIQRIDNSLLGRACILFYVMSDFHMIDILLKAVHAFASHVSMSVSVDETLIPR